MTIFNWLVVSFWIILLAYWAISARNVKKVAHRDPAGVWVRCVSAIIIILILVFEPSYLSARFGAHTIVAMTIGTILCGMGVAFAMWARWHLNRNWSPGPSVQEGHELVTSGPYRIVRHPIYAGILVALLGSALVNNVGWFVVFVLIGATFVWRINREERYMAQLFPEEYLEYKKRTVKKLIPLVW